MSKIKITKNPEEVYFKTVTQYDFEIDGKTLVVIYEEDSNGADPTYVIDGEHCHMPPEWLAEVEFGDEYIDECTDFPFDNWFIDVRHELEEDQTYESTTGELL